MSELIAALVIFAISSWLFDLIFPPKVKPENLFSDVKKGIEQGIKHGTKPRYLPTLSELKRDIPRIIGKSILAGFIAAVSMYLYLQFA